MGRIHNVLEYLDNKYSHYNAIKTEKIKIADKRRQKIANSHKLTDEQKQEIDRFYLKYYGKKIPYVWHQYYSSYTGNFDVRYIPELLFIPEIERRFVPKNYGEVLSDKNLLPLIIRNENGVKTPEIIISCQNGQIRNGDMEFITFDQAAELLKNAGKVFLKPTINSNSGKGCAVLDIQNSVDQKSGKELKEILKSQGKNFNIQELITNSKSLASLHPSSLNTLRITTYIWKGDIYHFPLLVRIGRGGNNMDNAHMGGMFVGLDDYGIIKNCAFTEFQERYYIHPDTKIKFDGYKIDETPQVIETVERLHQTIPQIGMISWDATIDDKSNVIIVEINTQGQTIWLSQMANGVGAFGENTEEILKWISK